MAGAKLREFILEVTLRSFSCFEAVLFNAGKASSCADSSALGSAFAGAAVLFHGLTAGAFGTVTGAGADCGFATAASAPRGA